MSESDTLSMQLLHPDWVSMDIDNLGKSLYTGDGVPLTGTIQNLKVRTIEDALNQGKHSVLTECLRSTEGLVNNRLRQKVWPMLLGLPAQNADHKHKNIDLENSLGLNHQSASFFLNDLDCNDLSPHKDEEQVKLDINRSFSILNHLQSFEHLPNESFTNIFSSSDIQTLKKHLLNIIFKILRKYPSLNYYQGYHDIASIILIMCYQEDQTHGIIDEELASRMLEHLTLYHLRDFMLTDINLSATHLRLIPALLESVDLDLFHLAKSINDTYVLTNGCYYDYNFYQALSPILTLYSHDLNNLRQLLLIWDFCLSYNSIIPNIYLYVSILVSKKEKIFERLGVKCQTFDELFHDTLDKDLIHSSLSPSYLLLSLSDSELIKILNYTEELLRLYPLDSLKNVDQTYSLWFKQYNKNSVLMTTSKLSMIPDEDSQFQESLDSGLQMDPDTLSELMNIQDREIAKLSAYDLSMQQQIMDQQDEMSASSTDIDSSGTNLLSSSLSSLTSATSSINTKILNTSSIILKKLLHSDGVIHHTETDPNNDNRISKRIYRMSFAVGFIGFLLHLLLSKNNALYQEFMKLTNLSQIMSYNFNSLLNKEALENVIYFIKTNFSFLFTSLTVAVNNVWQSLRENEGLGQSINMRQVGLGTLRDNVYGFSGGV